VAKRARKTKPTPKATPIVEEGEQVIELETPLPPDFAEGGNAGHLMCLSLPAVVDILIPPSEVGVEEFRRLRAVASETSLLEGTEGELGVLKRKLWCRIRQETGAKWQISRGPHAGMTAVSGTPEPGDFSEAALEELYDHLVWYLATVMKLARRLGRKRNTRFVGPSCIWAAVKHVLKEAPKRDRYGDDLERVEAG